VIELTTPKAGMEVCHEILKWTYRSTVKGKRDVRRCLKREREINYTSYRSRMEEVNEGPNREAGDVAFVALHVIIYVDGSH
jgi:hypothetical protein